jgi:hypothetical protein
MAGTPSSLWMFIAENCLVNFLSMLLSQVYWQGTGVGSENSHGIWMTFVIGFLPPKSLSKYHSLLTVGDELLSKLTFLLTTAHLSTTLSP